MKDLYPSWQTHLYLSCTFCLISTSISDVMSLSRYSDSCSVACSRSFWLSCNGESIEGEGSYAKFENWFVWCNIASMIRYLSSLLIYRNWPGLSVHPYTFLTNQLPSVVLVQVVEPLWLDLHWRLGVQVNWNLCQTAWGILLAWEQDPVQGTPFFSCASKTPSTYMCEPTTGSTGIWTPWPLNQKFSPLITWPQEHAFIHNGWIDLHI